MNATQLLLSTAITITTVLLILVSLQLISLLKHLKNNLKNDHATKKPEILSVNEKKNKVAKKKINLTTLLEKMKNKISHPKSSKKTFFKS